MSDVYLEFQDQYAGTQQIPILKDATRLGREPGLDVVIASRKNCDSDNARNGEPKFVC
ncbi:MAG TPA: hypothetical protein VJ372_25595 [Pyrinomonadaceae bacterium]|jgi:hypothetical protein|nr:hypothetical protein [Pyrinomonadaceae bacterium]